MKQNLKKLTHSLGKSLVYVSPWLAFFGLLLLSVYGLYSISLQCEPYLEYVNSEAFEAGMMCMAGGIALLIFFFLTMYAFIRAIFPDRKAEEVPADD